MIYMLSGGYECNNMVTRPVFRADFDSELGWGIGVACGSRFCSKGASIFI